MNFFVPTFSEKPEQKSTDQGKLTVYYDGACPKCIPDREHYEKLSGQAGEQVCWFDITGLESRLQEMGIDPQKAISELHVRDADGSSVSEEASQWAQSVSIDITWCHFSKSVSADCQSRCQRGFLGMPYKFKFSRQPIDRKSRVCWQMAQRSGSSLSAITPRKRISITGLRRMG